MLIQPLEASHLVRAVSFHFRVLNGVVVLSSSAIRPKTGTWKDETAIFFLSGLLAGKSTLFVSSVFQFMQTRLTSDSSIDDTCIQHGGMSISFANTNFFFIFPLSWFV